MEIFKVVCPGHPETPVSYLSAYAASLRAFQEISGGCNVVLLVCSEVDMHDVDIDHFDGRVYLKNK